MTKKESQETRIALLENNHKNVMDKIEEILERLSHFDDKLDKALENKANKWVEEVMRWSLYTIGGILITAFMYLIINK